MTSGAKQIVSRLSVVRLSERERDVYGKAIDEWLSTADKPSVAQMSTRELMGYGVIGVVGGALVKMENKEATAEETLEHIAKIAALISEKLK